MKCLINWFDFVNNWNIILKSIYHSHGVHIQIFLYLPWFFTFYALKSIIQIHPKKNEEKIVFLTWGLKNISNPHKKCLNLLKIERNNQGTIIIISFLWFFFYAFFTFFMYFVCLYNQIREKMTLIFLNNFLK